MLRLLYILVIAMAAQFFSGTTAAEVDRTLVPAFQDGRAGFIDKETREFIIPPRYKDVGFFVDGIAIVYHFDNEMSLIDRSGETLLTAWNITPAHIEHLSDLMYDQGAHVFGRVFIVRQDYDRGVYHADHGWIVPLKEFAYVGDFINDTTFFYEESIIVDRQIVKIPNKFSADEYFEDGYIIIREQKDSMTAKWGVIKPDGKSFISPIYNLIQRDASTGYWLGSKISSVKLYSAMIARSETNAITVDVIDPSGKVVRTFKASAGANFTGNGTYEYETAGDIEHEIDIITGNSVLQPSPADKYIIFSTSKGKGIKDLKGNILTPAYYEELSYFGDDLFLAHGGWPNDNRGLITADNKTVVGFKYRAIYDSNIPGLFVVSQLVNNKTQYGLIDENENPIIEPQYDYRFFFNSINQALVEKDRSYAIIDEKGREVLPFDYQGITSYNDGIFVYIIKRGGQHGIAGAGGKILIPPVYNYITKERDVPYWFEIYHEGLYGLYNSKAGLLIEPEYQDITPYEGVITAAIPSKQKNVPNLEFFIDLSGAKIGEYQEIKENKTEPKTFRVKKDNLYGVANSFGTMIIPCKYKSLNQVDPAYFKAVDTEGVTVYVGIDGTEYYPVK